MAKYIDANELLYSIDKHSELFNLQTNRQFRKGFKLAASIIQEQHAADVAPIKHGEWKKIIDGVCGETLWRCSCCREEFVTDDFTIEAKYCPNCGAKMEEEQDEILNTSRHMPYRTNSVYAELKAGDDDEPEI